MPTLHVCPLSQLETTLATTGASHLVTLMNVATAPARPTAIAEGRHLVIGMSDIVEPMDGHVVPADAHVHTLLDFVHGWDRLRPLVIHCYAGISRSTAAAYITACALRPEADEAALAQRLRAVSPSATPNPRLVALGDEVLGRGGRMRAAIAAIGRGADAFEGTPFHLPLD